MSRPRSAVLRTSRRTYALLLSSPFFAFFAFALRLASAGKKNWSNIRQANTNKAKRETTFRKLEHCIGSSTDCGVLRNREFRGCWCVPTIFPLCIYLGINADSCGLIHSALATFHLPSASCSQCLEERPQRGPQGGVSRSGSASMLICMRASTWDNRRQYSLGRTFLFHRT